MITYNAISQSDYEALLYNILIATEESGNPKFLPYADSEGIATIGVGFNLQDRGARRAVLESFGFNLFDPVDQAYESQIIDVVSELYGNDPTSLSLLRSRLDNIMATRNADPNVPDINKFQSQFSFLDVSDINSTFQDLIKTVYEDKVNNLTPNVPISTERAVLISLAWNGVLGPKLSAAINGTSGNGSDSDRAEAWYEIRYNSNGGSSTSNGIARRRFYESTLFGLYDEGVTPSSITDAQAREVYEMYTDHRVDILNYENQFSSQIPFSNNQYNTVGNPVETLEDSLVSAANYLIQNYAAPTRFGDIDPLDIQVANNTGQTLTGTERNGYLITSGNNANQRNDLLIGGDGIDYLYGLGGDDILVGGLNDDNLFGSSGRDEMYGEGGDDLLVGDDDTVQDQLEGGIGQDTYLVHNNDNVIDSGLDGLVTVHGPRVNINNIQVAA